MSTIRLLSQRLAERRFLKDGASDASLLPGALTTLAISTLLGSLLLGELSAQHIALIAACAVFCWSLLKALLEAGDQESDAVDAAFLLPLPIRRVQFASARAIVAAAGVFVDACNLTLPIIVMYGCTEGVVPALRIAGSVLLALCFGVLIAAPLRRLLRNVLNVLRVAESEGPIRLAAMLLAFVAIVRAPHLDVSALLQAPWHYLPPISFVEAIHGAVPATILASILAFGLALVLLRIPNSAVPTPPRRRGRGIRSWFVAERARRSCTSPVEQAGFELTLAGIRSDKSFRARTFPLLAFPFAAIVLAGLDEYDATLVPMALFGATVYLVLGEVFLLFSESPGGPELLASLPMSDPQRFRLGAEKAYVAAIVVPTHLTISFGVAVFDLARGNVADLVSHAILGVLALLTSVLIVLLAFQRVGGMPFATLDRALYPDDLTGGAYFALALATLAALISAATLSAPWKSALLAGLLFVLIRLVLRGKRVRCLPEPANV